MPKRKVKTTETAPAAAIAADTEFVDQSIFGQLGIDPSYTGDGTSNGKDKDKDKTKAAAAGDTAALQARIDDLQRQLNTAARTNSALMTPAAITPAATDKRPAFDMAGLPDPAEDPETYNRKLAERVQTFAQETARFEARSATADIRSAADRERLANQLWTRFSAAHPDLAKERDLVEFVATSVANDAASRGVEVNRYLTQGQDQFIDDIAKRMKERFGKALGGEDNESDTDETEDDTGAAASAPVSRAVGIPGGLPTLGSGNNRDTLPKSDLVSELRAIQRKIGLF